jgi:hypothetical protein
MKYGEGREYERGQTLQSCDVRYHGRQGGTSRGAAAVQRTPPCIRGIEDIPTLSNFTFAFAIAFAFTFVFHFSGKFSMILPWAFCHKFIGYRSYVVSCSIESRYGGVQHESIVVIEATGSAQFHLDPLIDTRPQNEDAESLKISDHQSQIQ